MDEHPMLKVGSAKAIERVRSEATTEGLQAFFWEYLRHVLERRATAERIFNMDETGSRQSQKSKKVVAMHGSKNDWTKTLEANFRIAVTTCVSGNGFVVPPIFLVPGKRLNSDVMDACDIAGAVVTVDPKG